jgi:hypothetical protein
MKRVFFLSLLFLTSLVCAQTTDSQYLYGIHWYGKTDSFNINITANGSNITFTAYKNGGTSPAVEWSITDDGQKVGWIRIMTWNLNEARVNDFKLGGAQWGGSIVTDWEAF